MGVLKSTMESTEIQIANQEAHLETVKGNVRIANEELSGIFTEIELANQILRATNGDVRVASENLGKLNAVMQEELADIVSSREKIKKERDSIVSERAEHLSFMAKAKTERDELTRDLSNAKAKLAEAVGSLVKELDDLDATREARENVSIEIDRLETVIRIANEKLVEINGDEAAKVAAYELEVEKRNKTISELDAEIEIKSRALDGHGKGLREYEDSLKRKEKKLLIYAGRLKKHFDKLGINMPTI